MLLKSAAIPAAYGLVQRIRHIYVDWLGIGVLFALCVLIGFLVFPPKRKVEEREATPPESATEFKNLRLEQQQPIVGKIFHSEIMDIDGKSFTNCKFVHAKLRYNGQATFSLSHCSFSDSVPIPDKPEIVAVLFLLKALGMLSHMKILGPDYEPIPNVENGKRRDTTEKGEQ